MLFLNHFIVCLLDLTFCSYTHPFRLSCGSCWLLLLASTRLTTQRGVACLIVIAQHIFKLGYLTMMSSSSSSGMPWCDIGFFCYVCFYWRQFHCLTKSWALDRHCGLTKWTGFVFADKTTNGILTGKWSSKQVIALLNVWREASANVNAKAIFCFKMCLGHRFLCCLYRRFSFSYIHVVWIENDV